MSLEAIATVSQAEEKAKQVKAEAAAKAKRAVKDAEEAGKVLVDEAKRKAAAELEELGAKAKLDSAAVAEVIRENTEKEKDELRTHAAARMADAAESILERIVNS